jgi:hypothetical protein
MSPDYIVFVIWATTCGVLSGVAIDTGDAILVGPSIVAGFLAFHRALVSALKLDAAE